MDKQHDEKIGEYLELMTQKIYHSKTRPTVDSPQEQHSQQGVYKQNHLHNELKH